MLGVADLYEREGTNCENLPETHAYLKRLRAFVDEYAPGTLLLSEANQWPEDVRPYLGDGDTAWDSNSWSISAKGLDPEYTLRRIDV